VFTARRRRWTFERKKEPPTVQNSLAIDKPWRLVVQNDIQQRTVDLHIAIVFDKSQMPEFVHEVAYAGPRCANHLRKRLLTDFRYDGLRRSFLAELCHEEKEPRQPFLARIEKLVDQILSVSET
jgi:hypothetical protein